MTRRNFLTSSLALSSLVLARSDAIAQQKSLKDRLVGTWALVSATVVEAGGAKSPLVKGSDVKGLHVFTESGRVSLQVIGDHPKVASNDRLKMTADEMKDTAESVLSFFGTYTVNDAEGSYTMAIERSTYSNQVGANKRLVKFEGDQMTVTNPARIGGGQVIMVWRKVG